MARGSSKTARRSTRAAWSRGEKPSFQLPPNPMLITPLAKGTRAYVRTPGSWRMESLAVGTPEFAAAIAALAEAGYTEEMIAQASGHEPLATELAALLADLEENAA